MQTTEFEIGQRTYRLRRSDKLNVNLERQARPEDTPLHLMDKPTKPGWVIIAHCGNSIPGIVRALREAVIEQHQPDDEPILAQLEKLESAFNAGVDRIEQALKAHI